MSIGDKWFGTHGKNVYLFKDTNGESHYEVDADSAKAARRRLPKYLQPNVTLEKQWPYGEEDRQTRQDIFGSHDDDDACTASDSFLCKDCVNSAWCSNAVKKEHTDQQKRKN